MVKTKLLPQGRQESEALRELKLICMSNLLSTTDERVYFKDLQSRFLFLSAGWIAACAPGRAAEELIGKTDFDVFSAHHASAAFEDEQQIIRTGEPLVAKVERETYGGRADAWVSSTKMPLRDEHGQIIGTFGISPTAQRRKRQSHPGARSLRRRSRPWGARHKDAAPGRTRPDHRPLRNSRDVTAQITAEHAVAQQAREL